MIAALTRNEIEHRKAFIDDAQEEQIRRFGKVFDPHPEIVSIGNQQMQLRHISRLVNARDRDGNFVFSQLEGLRGDPARKALEPKNGALLLGAYLQDVSMRLERGEDPTPWYDKAHKVEVRETMQKLWKSGAPEKRTDALIRSYNPGGGQEHVDNVRRHLQIIKHGVGKLFI